MAIGREVEFQNEEKSSNDFGRPIELKKTNISRLESLLNSMKKGSIQGFLDLGEWAKPLLLEEETPENRQEIQEASHQYRKNYEEKLEETSPSYPNFSEGALQRGSRLAVQGGPKGFIAGAIGEGLKQSGAPEWAQTAGEVVGFGLPKLGRKIIPTQGQNKLVDFARKSGLSEEQITPLIQSNKKTAFFSKVAHKGEKTQKALSETKKAVNDLYGPLESGPLGKLNMTPQQSTKFLQDSSDILKKFPHEIREQIKHDAADLISGGPSLENLANFYHDISSKFKLGKEQLELLKKPILEAMEAVSPEFASDFKNINGLFKQSIKIRKALKPSQFEGLLKMGELGTAAYNLLKLNYTALTGLLGAAGVRRFSREMLINPRLQNIHLQMAKAVNDNQIGIALDLSKYLQDKYADKESNQKSKSK